MRTEAQAQVNTRGAALVRAALNKTGRSLEQIRQAMDDAGAVRDAYLDALERAVADCRQAERQGARPTLDAGARVIAAIKQLNAAQAHVNALAAEAQLVLVGWDE